VIFENHTWRLARESIGRVVYFCDPATARIVAREADVRVFRDDRSRIVVLPVFDVRGKWVGDERAAWNAGSPAPTPLAELAGEWGQA
jgi:hypothetical protein